MVGLVVSDVFNTVVECVVVLAAARVLVETVLLLLLSVLLGLIVVTVSWSCVEFGTTETLPTDFLSVTAVVSCCRVVVCTADGPSLTDVNVMFSAAKDDV